MIRAIIFDCFGVVYTANQPGLRQALAASGSADLRDLIGEGEYGLIDGKTLDQGIAAMTGRTVDDVERHLTAEFARNQELMAFAQRLRQSYKVALLSNLGPDTIERFFTTKERTDLFDTFIVSSEVGMVKPHPEVFEYACQQLGVDVSEAVMIDDTQENCDGARQAGLEAIRFESTPQIQRDLSELLGNHA